MNKKIRLNSSGLKKILSLALLSTSLLTTTSNAGDWRNNGNEESVGGLQTFVYEPTSTPALDGKRALMVSLHGCSQPNNDFKTGAGWAPLADEYGMVIALPQASGEGTYGMLLGCWNFHTGMNTSRDSSDAKYLVAMVEELIADTSLNIDPKQVYLTGLSSGAGMTNTESCIAPDIFAGVGVNAGPAPGSAGSDLSTPGISVSQGKSNCKTLANQDGYNNQSHLYTQLWNTVHGTEDGSVSPAHAHRNADIAVAVYNEDTPISSCGTDTIPGASSGNHGDLTQWCDADGPRVSKILVNGMGHAWPAGNNSSGGGNYIDHNHINYPEWITAWFFANNRRVETDDCTVTNTCPIDVNSLILSGANPLTLDNCETYAEPVYIATDANAGDITNSVVINGNSFDSCIAGSYNITYAVDFSDGESASQIRAITVEDEAPVATCQEHTANNYSHTAAARAYASFGFTYALGSNEYMGLWSAFSTTTLAETSEGYFEVGSCPE